MIYVSMIFVICQFFLSGMLTSAILTNRAQGRPVNWNLYAFAVLCFLFGIYYIVALIGAASNL